jgi:integrase/recombinase XerD
MTQPAITPLRQRMLEDMAIRRLAPGTQAFYVSAVAKFAKHCAKSPDLLGYEDVRAYQLHLVGSGLDVASVNRAVTALRFFYRVTMGWRDAPDMIPLARRPEKMRAVLTPEEVARLIDAAPGAKYRAALSVAYGAGLRASEVVSLKASDIDSARMVIRVEAGKGRRDRYAS